jgi:hypothetical protein
VPLPSQTSVRSADLTSVALLCRFDPVALLCRFPLGGFALPISPRWLCSADFPSVALLCRFLLGGFGLPKSTGLPVGFVSKLICLQLASFPQK